MKWETIAIIIEEQMYILKTDNSGKQEDLFKKLIQVRDDGGLERGDISGIGS